MAGGQGSGIWVSVCKALRARAKQMVPFLLWLRELLWECGQGRRLQVGTLRRRQVTTYCVAREEKGQLPLGHPVPMYLGPPPSSLPV